MNRRGFFGSLLGGVSLAAFVPKAIAAVAATNPIIPILSGTTYLSPPGGESLQYPATIKLDIIRQTIIPHPGSPRSFKLNYKTGKYTPIY